MAPQTLRPLPRPCPNKGLLATSDAADNTGCANILVCRSEKLERRSKVTAKVKINSLGRCSETYGSPGATCAGVCARASPTLTTGLRGLTSAPHRFALIATPDAPPAGPDKMSPVPDTPPSGAGLRAPHAHLRIDPLNHPRHIGPRIRWHRAGPRGRREPDRPQRQKLASEAEPASVPCNPRASPGLQAGANAGKDLMDGFGFRQDIDDPDGSLELRLHDLLIEPDRHVDAAERDPPAAG